MLRFKVSFYFLLFAVCLFAQTARNYENYYNLRKEAIISKVNGNAQQAILLYEKAFANNYPFVEDLLELKNCYKLINDTANIVKTWERFILTGYVLENKSYLIIDDSNKSVWEYSIPADEKFVFNVINYDLLRNKYLKNGFNSEKNNYLQAIITNECFANQTRKKYANNYKKYNETGNITFGTNGYLFINLAKSEYLPNRQESNLWEDDQFIVALVHIAASLKGNDLEVFLNILKENLICGNLCPENYAAIYDHAKQGHKKGKNYYGTSLEQNNENQIVIVEPQEISNIDVRRAEIFLPPLWVWAKKTGFLLPKNYIRAKEVIVLLYK
jgi:hypothetical protein